MYTIADIKRSMVELEERHILREFGEKIEALMSPFQTGRIEAEIVESYSSISRFIIRIEHFGEFTFPIHPEEEFSLEYVLGQLTEIYNESRLEPEDNVVLSTN